MNESKPEVKVKDIPDNLLYSEQIKKLLIFLLDQDADILFKTANFLVVSKIGIEGYQEFLFIRLHSDCTALNMLANAPRYSHLKDLDMSYRREFGAELDVLCFEAD